LRKSRINNRAYQEYDEGYSGSGGRHGMILGWGLIVLGALNSCFVKGLAVVTKN
jgi:hypothetical protein